MSSRFSTNTPRHSPASLPLDANCHFARTLSAHKRLHLTLYQVLCLHNVALHYSALYGIRVICYPTAVAIFFFSYIAFFFSCAFVQKVAARLGPCCPTWRAGPTIGTSSNGPDHTRPFRGIVIYHQSGTCGDLMRPLVQAAGLTTVCTCLPRLSRKAYQVTVLSFAPSQFPRVCFFPSAVVLWLLAFNRASISASGVTIGTSTESTSRRMPGLTRSRSTFLMRH